MLLVFILSILPFTMSAQRQKKELPKDAVVKYKILENNPENASKLNISITPFYVELSQVNTVSGAMAEVNCIIENTFGVYGRFQNAMHNDGEIRTSIFNGPDGGGGMSAAISQRFRNIEFCGTHYFKHTNSVYNGKIVVRTEYSGGKKILYYIVVPSRRLHLWGARLGFQSLRSTVSADRNSFAFDAIINNNNRLLLDNSYYSTMMGMNTINVGGSFTSIIDAIADVEGLGKKKMRSISEFYADVLFAPSIVYTDMAILVDGKDVTIGDVNEYTKRSRLGLRLGAVAFRVAHH
ncbi:MAG: hypothetical protein ACXWEY_12570 [Bacteroidia bacterium]